MEAPPVCTCNERARATRRMVATPAVTVERDATATIAKDNRPNGSAIRNILGYRSAGSRSCFLIKEVQRSGSKKSRNCNSDGEGEKCSRTRDDVVEDVGEIFTSKKKSNKKLHQQCSSKICETTLSNAGVVESRILRPSPQGCSDLWDEEILMRHIKECRCTCNHMGYGNYMDWDEGTRLAVPPAPPRCLPVPAGTPVGPSPRSYGAADCTQRLDKKMSPGTPVSITTDPDSPSDKGSAPRSWCLACMLLVLLTLTGIGVVLPLTARMRHGAHNLDHLSAVRRMLREVPLIDGHNDLAWNIRNFVHNQLQRFNFSEDLRTVAPWSTSSWSQTDLPRIHQGMLGAQFWSAYVPCEAQYKDAVQLTLEQINVIRRLVDSYSNDLQFVTTAHACSK